LKFLVSEKVRSVLAKSKGDSERDDEVFGFRKSKVSKKWIRFQKLGNAFSIRVLLPVV